MLTSSDPAGRTAFAVVSPLAVPGTYSQTADHYSLLQTIEDGFGITNFLGNAAAGTPDQQSLCSGRCRLGRPPGIIRS
jgi:hypothetical protein